MMKKTKHKLSLYKTVTYQITIPGHHGESWSDWAGEMLIKVDREDPDQPVTTLTTNLDQAALQGLLRRLYSLGVPLISVNWIADD